MRGTSHIKLYEESGYTTLKERRKRHKIIFLHKIIHGLCPPHLSTLCPPLVSEINRYHRRRPLERYIPNCKTELYKNSFFPSATKLYNELPDNIKTVPSISNLKHFLSQSDIPVPIYYSSSRRRLDILHARLRLGMSDLNYDLFRRHLLENPACDCGDVAETAEHYFLICTKYIEHRQATISNLPLNHQNIQTLLNGDSTLTNEQNEAIFTIIQDFIEITDRF